MSEKRNLEFHGGKFMALAPLAIFIFFCILFFIVLQIYSMDALAMGGFIAIIIGSLLAKNMQEYWDVSVRGMCTELANTLALILIVVGIFSKMMARGGIASGFVWVGVQLSLSGATFCAFTFVATSILATATGTSIGTIITGMTILYPAGLLLGAHPIVLVGAIMSGALFGDSIGPVSDVTIASCSTQEYTQKHGSSDIGGTVASRIKFSLAAGILALILFFIFGGSSQNIDLQGTSLLAQYSDPKGLLMLIPVVILLAVAITKKNIYMAITTGVISGTIVGIVGGIFPTSEIMSVNNGELRGFLIEGITSMMGTVFYVYALCAIINILKECGLMDSVINSMSKSKLAESVVGTELIICVGSVVTGFCLGGGNGPACIMFGPIANDLGQRQKLHPYRRSHLLAGITSSIPVMIPFASLFISITISTINSLRMDYSFIPQINPFSLPLGMFFCITFALVWLFSIFTGWGREYEGKNGVPVKKLSDAYPDLVDASEFGGVN